MTTIGIVVSDTYPEITGKMLDCAQQKAKELTVKTVVLHVPGSFDIPYGVSTLIDDVDGVVTLGAIIQGETSHDEIIGHSVANALTRLSIDCKKPVVLGVSGPRMTREQAINRIEPFGARSVEACVSLIVTSAGEGE